MKRVSPIFWILLLAAGLRLWGLEQVPPALQFDEAHNAIDASRVADGTRDLFFWDNGGREPLVSYLHAPALALLGEARPELALRLISAIAGLLTIYCCYRLWRSFFRRELIALYAAGFMAFSYWHLHFSRYGIRAILAPLWTALAIWAWWLAVRPDEDAETTEPRSGRRVSRSWAPALACGAALAGAVYSHPSGRLLPFILIVHTLYRTFRLPDLRFRTWRSLCIAGITAFILFLPLGLFFLQHPDAFLGHPSDVSLKAVAEADYGGSLARAFLANAGAALGMFFISGDPSTFHNLPYLPVFDPLSALCFVFGLGVLLGATFRKTMITGEESTHADRAFLLWVWLGVLLLPTLLSDRPPNYSRAIAALPVITLFPALGLDWIIRRLGGSAGQDHPQLEPRSSAQRIGLLGSQTLLSGIVLGAAFLWTSWHYFKVFGKETQHVYYSYDVEKEDAFRALSQRAEQAGQEVFLHPLWADHASVAYLNRDGLLKRLDARQTLVLPANRPDALFAFPAKEAELEGWAEDFRAAFGAVAEEEFILDAQGNPSVLAFHIPQNAFGNLIPPNDAPLEPEHWSGEEFGRGIELLGYSVQSSPEFSIALYWRCRAEMSENFTVFLHIDDSAGRRLGQLDIEPGNTSYRTSDWQPGDLIVDRLSPEIDSGATGPVMVRLGWYLLETGERLPLKQGGDSVLIGPFALGGGK